MIEPVLFIQLGYRTMIEFVQWPDWPGRDQTKQHFGCRGEGCQRISMSVCLDSTNLLCLACSDMLWKRAVCRMVMSIPTL